MIIQHAKFQNPFIKLLVAACAFCLCLSIGRIIFTGSFGYIFLNWNLFLAFLPWAFSFYLTKTSTTISKLKLAVLFAMWLLFFPNSPYILTDLFHLRKDSLMPIWYDLILILSYAWTALLFGFSSLKQLEILALSKMNENKVNLLICFLLFAASFGVYLGRFLRWNSWDIITHPFSLLRDIFLRFSDPTSHLRTWGVTLLMGIFLCLVYFSIKFMNSATNAKSKFI